MKPSVRLAAGAGAAFLFSHLGMQMYAAALETRLAVVVLLAVDALALMVGAWASRSLSIVALLGCAIVAPVLLWVRVPEAGAWWHLLAIYKFTVLTLVGWWGWFRAARSADKRGGLLWAGALLPTASVLGVLCLLLAPA